MNQYPLPKEGTDEHRAFGYWSHIGELSAMVSRFLQRRRILVILKEFSSHFHSDYIQKIMTMMIAGMQAFSIEMLIKAALIMTGSKVRNINPTHSLHKLWKKLEDNDKNLVERCVEDLSSRRSIASAMEYEEGGKGEKNIPTMLKDHHDDFHIMRYGQTRQGKGSMMKEIVATDRLGLFLFIQTLERVIFYGEDPISPDDTDKVKELRKTLDQHFGRDRGNPTQRGKT